MRFLEVQHYVEKDKLLSSYLRSKMQGRHKLAKRGDIIYPTCDQVFLINSGIVVRKTNYQGVIEQIFYKDDIIYLTATNENENEILESLENATYFIYSFEKLSLMLEKEGLLSHFFYLLLANIEAANKNRIELENKKVEERIVIVINWIFNYMYPEKLIEKSVSLPKWLNQNILAQLINANPATVSVKLAQLAKQNVLQTNSIPWKLTAGWSLFASYFV